MSYYAPSIATPLGLVPPVDVRFPAPTVVDVDYNLDPVDWPREQPGEVIEVRGTAPKILPTAGATKTSAAAKKPFPWQTVALVALGIGAIYLLTKKRAAAPVPVMA